MKKKIKIFPAFTLYYGIALWCINNAKIAWYISSEMGKSGGQNAFPYDDSLIGVVAFHFGLAILFLASLLFRKPRLLLTYFSLYFLVDLIRYLSSLLGYAEIMEIRFSGIIGVPIFMIAPQGVAIFLLISKIRNLNKAQKSPHSDDVTNNQTLISESKKTEITSES